MPIAKNIKYLRKQNQITQKELADRLGCKSQSTIQKWETKVSSPPIQKVRMIAEMFHRDFAEICDVDLEKQDTELFAGDPPSREEMMSLQKFRALPDNVKMAIRSLINAEYENTELSP